MRLTMEESRPAGTKDEAVGDPTKVEETGKTEEEVKEEKPLTENQATEELNGPPSLLKGTGK